MSTIFQALDAKTGLIPDGAPEPPVNIPNWPVAEPVTRGPAVAEGTSRIRTLQLNLPPQSPVLPFDGSNERAGEQYRLVRTNILQNPD
jgi:hypothetical protein